MELFQISLAAGLESVGIPTSTDADSPGLWGRSGRLVEFGVTVRNDVAHQGAFVNVNPSLGLFDLLTPGQDSVPVGSLQAEKPSAAQMPRIRTAMIQAFAQTFNRDQYHLYCGHPWLTRRDAA